MQVIRILLLSLALGAGPIAAARAAADAGEDWRLLGRMLALVQQFTQVAAESADPQSMGKGIDAMLSGQNPEANRLASSLFEEMFQDLPFEQKGAMASIARNLAAIAKRDKERAAAGPEPIATERAATPTALQARRDLHGIGLRYHDTPQFLDAVRRGDALAVELFVLARGVNLSARDADGSSALEIAQREGNRQIAALLRGAGSR